MTRKIVLVADPGIDTAFAVALALHDPTLDVVGLLPTAGNVSAEQATANVQILIDQFDPARWPRTATAVAATFDADGTALHGPGGLGGVSFPAASRHQNTPADKALCELVRQFPHDVTVIVLGPATTVARAFARDPELPALVDRLILVAGAYREAGNAGPAAEFHAKLDPEALREVLQVGLLPLVIPLDVTRKFVLSPTELLELPNPESKTCRFLRQVVPYGIRASSHLYGIEGFHLKDVVGVAAAALPGCVTAVAKTMDVEVRGELTRGMTVVDDRATAGPANVQLATGVAVGEVRQWVSRVLKAAP